jgi:hypothetical protein
LRPWTGLEHPEAEMVDLFAPILAVAKGELPYAGVRRFGKPPDRTSHAGSAGIVWLRAPPFII